jgi:hypothetical protein
MRCADSGAAQENTPDRDYSRSGVAFFKTRLSGRAWQYSGEFGHFPKGSQHAVSAEIAEGY